MLGLVSLATVTGLYFWLDVPLVGAAFTYLVVLVLLSLVSNFSSLIVLSLIGVCCLNYFFTPPIFSFRVDYAQDLITLSAFVITSFVVNFLVTRVRVEQRDHIRAQEALRESERSLRSAIDGIPGHLAVLAPNGEVETVNRQSLEYFGRSLEWIKKWGTNDALHPEDLPRVVEVLRRAVASGLPFQFEQRMRRFDGEYRWFNTRGDPVRDDSGRIARWYLLATDIEDRKRAEHALRSAFDGIAGLVSVIEPNGKLKTVNRQVLDYFGRSLEELKQWETSDAVHPEDLPRVLELFKKTIASGIPFNFELRMRRFDGEYRWFETRGVPIRDDSGRIVRWYLLNTDIEDRKRAEHASRSALDGIAGLVAIMAPNGEVETVNRQSLEYFGRSLEELKQWGTNDAVHPEDLPRILELYKRAMAFGLPFNFELRMRRFDGEYRWFDNRGVPIRDDSGRIARWCVLLTDIEDRTRALAQLEQMQSDFAHMNRVSMLGEWAAELSHEITQPIASARNNARAAQNFKSRLPSLPSSSAYYFVRLAALRLSAPVARRAASFLPSERSKRCST